MLFKECNDRNIQSASIVTKGALGLTLIQCHVTDSEGSDKGSRSSTPVAVILRQGDKDLGQTLTLASPPRHQQVPIL
ncbi:hypothetical protein RRG08_023484 [Elysia crispata]|uniref:Uncharacterized protein n=1 Tax=Elysia crispata TaxID=231223 RepID=A0AAE0YY14_9GAST|nr:hypothetical protein RRG08_023484 [Elysia crispata]